MTTNYRGIVQCFEDDFELLYDFVSRYKRRVQNFKNYLKSGKKIIFILTKMNCTYDDCKDLSDIIKIKYPTLDFDFHFIELPLNIIFLSMKIIS